MSGGDPGPHAFFLFQDTTEVLWAEEVAQESRIPVEVVPSPLESEDLCGLAIRTLPGKAEELSAVLKEEGLDFRVHSDPG